MPYPILFHPVLASVLTESTHPYLCQEYPLDLNSNKQWTYPHPMQLHFTNTKRITPTLTKNTYPYPVFL